MAQKKAPKLDTVTARSIAQKARKTSELKAIAKIADENLRVSETNHWRVLAPEHLEAIRFRVLGGDTVSNICRELGIDAGHVANHIYLNPEYAAQLNEYRKHGAHALVDKLFELPFRDDMSDNDKKLYQNAITWYASRMNREAFGEKVTVDHIQHLPVILATDVIASDDDDGV